MHNDEIIAVAAQLAAERSSKPTKLGASRKRIRYSPASVQRASQLYRQSGQEPTVFARRLGVSPSALERWAQEGKAGSAFIPVLAAAEVSPRDEPAAVKVAEGPKACETRTVTPPMAAFLLRETVVSLPAGLDGSRLREIVMALRAGGPC
jgi:transposase-like protein